MSLNQSALKQSLLSAFQSMKDGDDTVFAQKVRRRRQRKQFERESGITACTSLPKGKLAENEFCSAAMGTIITADVGAVSVGAFTGAGNGAITVQASVCFAIVLAACKTMSNLPAGGNAVLAAQLASGIDAMMSAGSVITTVTGAAVTPVGASVPLAGSAKGSFIGVSATLIGAFTAAFSAMESMTENGDDFLAEQIAAAVTSYLSAGIISTQGLAPIAGSVGTGKMT